MGLQVFGWSTSALVTSHTGSLPRCGRVKRITVDHHCCPCFELRQPGRFCSSTLSAASTTVGIGPNVVLVGERVDSLAGDLAVGNGRLAGLGERDEWDCAEAEFAPPAADDEPLDAASAAGRLDEEVDPPLARSLDHGCLQRLGLKDELMAWADWYHTDEGMFTNYYSGPMGTEGAEPYTEEGGMWYYDSQSGR